MAKSLLRPCLHCKELFRLHRNGWHQQFCLQPVCRKASKLESQRRWQSKPANQDYFRGSANVERVQQWRQRNPGYWKRPSKAPGTLQDLVTAQPAQEEPVAPTSSPAPLQDLVQDLVANQDPLLLGLISQLIDSPLQDHIEQTTLRLLFHGRNILDMRSRSKTKGTMHEDQKAGAVSGAIAPSAGPIQLDRSTINPTIQLSQRV